MSPPPSTARLQVVLCGGDAALHRLTATALEGLAEVSTEDDAPQRADLYLVVVSARSPAGVQAFVRLRQAHAGVPIFYLGEDLTPDFAVELVKLGGTDFLALPFERPSLRHKVERAVRGRFLPAFDAPLFEPLLPKEGEQPDPRSPTGQNRRRCFRAPVPSELALAVLLPSQGNLRLHVEELSVAMDGFPGGMRLRGEAATAPRMPPLGAEVTVNVQLTGEPAPLPGKIRVLRSGFSAGHVWIGVQYSLNQKRDEERIQRLWIQCQRQKG